MHNKRSKLFLNKYGFKVNSTSELHELIIQFNPGDEINCTIQREKYQDSHSIIKILKIACRF